MARNSEKAMTMLARWRDYTLKLERGEKERRPYIATECTDIKKCERWRNQIIGEIAKKVAQIQNAGLGEFRIRDLNDEINKLLREKSHWEDQIKALGGPDYRRIGPRMLDHEGKEVPGNRGYKYFGAAKDLPGVRELFEQEPAGPPRKTRAELCKEIDADYYGYRDEDDGILVPVEKEQEKEAIARAVEEWKAEKESMISSGEQVKDDDDEEDNLYAAVTETLSGDEGSEETPGPSHTSVEAKTAFKAHVPVPSQKEVEEALLRRKKMELLEQYCTDSLIQQSQEAKTLLGL